MIPVTFTLPGVQLIDGPRMIGNSISSEWLDKALSQANKLKNDELIEEIRLEKEYLDNNKIDKVRQKEKVKEMISMEIKYQKFALELYGRPV